MYFSSPTSRLRIIRREIRGFFSLMLLGDLQNLKPVRNLHSSERRNKELKQEK
jgi:hypothetical protein